MIITFDLPLWIKDTLIVLETGMPIVVRLGGFHTLKSFLDCIGYIMADSGLEELIKLVYPGDVTHISDGGSYYNALRAHFMIDAQWRNVAPALPGGAMRRGRQNFELKLFGCKNAPYVGQINVRWWGKNI